MNVGTRVVAITDDTWNGREGAVIGRSLYYENSWDVTLDGTTVSRVFTDHELAPIPYVKVVKIPTIWVTLPGDTVSRKLSVEDANRLLRQLEVALS